MKHTTIVNTGPCADRADQISVLTARTYRARRENLDLAYVQFKPEVRDGVPVISFYAITKPTAQHAIIETWVEGTLSCDGDVTITRSFSDPSDIGSQLDNFGLEQSIRQAYKNIVEIDHKSTKNQRPSGESYLLHNHNQYFSDQPNEPNTHYIDQFIESVCRGLPKTPHIRRGFQRLYKGTGKIVSVLPTVIHIDQYTAEELINSGFSPLGETSQEAVRLFCPSLSSEQQDELSRERKLRPLDELIVEYESDTKNV
jgi:hypothetical protein